MHLSGRGEHGIRMLAVCETLLERSVEAARLQGIEEEAMGKVEEHVEESNVGSR